MTTGPESREQDREFRKAERDFKDAGKRGAHEMDKVTRDVKKGLDKFADEAREGAEEVDDALDRE
jgi:hypothetical protein